jgi:RNA polymerase sigma-70 factor (ECF subfamily)
MPNPIQPATQGAKTPGPGDSRSGDSRLGESGQGEFARVVLPHFDAAHNLARWLVRDPSLAEDAVQNAMLRALTYFPSYRGGNAKAWLLQITRNAALNLIAERRRPAEIPIEPEDDEAPALDLVDPGDDPETALARRQERGRLDRLLAALPVELRECLVLRELEDMSYREIAQVTGMPIGTVMSRLWRARRMLMKAAERSVAG